ncbi:hypothetical protein QN277_023033 [Acacia crassicarpa]|uniref:Patatin n=1 Tax=Acacia crassicarpa TaxID=499986 RepID=A0AAE1JKX2_9FABA|nr:hypothetical protein QN277_023033 [Acacia crassicarpa]
MLQDICIGTTAAPTYFPPHYFKNESQEFHLIDGGVIANNPAMIAICEVALNRPPPQERPDEIGNTSTAVKKDLDWLGLWSQPLSAKEGGGEPREKMNMSALTRELENPIPEVKPNEYDKIYVVSLGTGLRKRDEEVGVRRTWWQWLAEKFLRNKVYDARIAQNWGILAWGAGPITNLTLDGSQDMVDYHLASVFRTLHKSNYLRIIQTDELSGDMVDMDRATEENIGDLEKLAKEEILGKQVKRINLETFELEDDPENNHTYKEALESVAKFLHKSRKEKQKQIIPE